MLEYFSSFTWININELEYLACLVSEFQVYVDEKHYFILFQCYFFEYRPEDFLTYDQRREIG